MLPRQPTRDGSELPPHPLTVLYSIQVKGGWLNPSNAKATFIQSTRTRFLKNI